MESVSFSSAYMNKILIQKTIWHLLLVAKFAGQGNLIRSGLVGDLEGAGLQVAGDVVRSLLTLLLLVLDLAVDLGEQVLVNCNMKQF